MPVRVSAPAHLHAGNVDLHGGLGRVYGTLGFTISAPRTVVRVEYCSELGASGELAGYAREYLLRLVEAYNLPPMCVEVESSVPYAVGMGSRSALALSIAEAARRLSGGAFTLTDAARLLGRGSPVGLGYYSFTTGGMILDGGADGRTVVAPLISRIELPEEWRFLVIIPEEPLPRIRELKAREEELLAKLPRMPEELAARAARLLVMGVLPTAAEGRLGDMLRRLEEFNRLLGEYWAPMQGGGVYCCELVEELIEYLHRLGFPGAAQSSWGPTVYTIAPSASEAWSAAREVRGWLERRGGGRVYIAAPDNRGAVVLPA